MVSGNGGRTLAGGKTNGVAVLRTSEPDEVSLSTRRRRASVSADILSVPTARRHSTSKVLIYRRKPPDHHARRAAPKPLSTTVLRER